MMEEPKNIYESFDKMTALCHEKIRLMGELKRALRMADLLGVPARSIKGKLRAGIQHGNNSQFRPWVGAVYTLQIDDGEVHRFPLSKVHVDLWPADILAAHQRWQRHEATRKVT